MTDSPPDRVNHDTAINALRAARERVEEMLTTASDQVIHYRAIIKTLAARNAMLEDEVITYRETVQMQSECIRNLESASATRYHTRKDRGGTYQQQLDRMENVVKLATAAIRHIEADRPAIAIQLLTPLAGGRHDANPENGASRLDIWYPKH